MMTTLRINLKQNEAVLGVLLSVTPKHIKQIDSKQKLKYLKTFFFHLNQTQQPPRRSASCSCPRIPILCPATVGVYHVPPS